MEKTKYISAKEVAQALGIPMVTVIRWAHQGKIPCKLKRDGYVFDWDEISDWAGSHDFVPMNKKTLYNDSTQDETISLRKAIERGEFIYNLPGCDIYSILKNALEKITLPEGTNKDKVLHELISREEIASTGIGKGVAIPHPRCTLNLKLEKPVIFVIFLERSIDFSAVDGKEVFVLFMMFSPCTEVHLKLLSRLSLCLREESFLTLLKDRAQKDKILSEIQRIETLFDSQKNDNLQ